MQSKNNSIGWFIIGLLVVMVLFFCICLSGHAQKIDLKTQRDNVCIKDHPGMICGFRGESPSPIIWMPNEATNRYRECPEKYCYYPAQVVGHSYQQTLESYGPIIGTPNSKVEMAHCDEPRYDRFCDTSFVGADEAGHEDFEFRAPMYQGEILYGKTTTGRNFTVYQESNGDFHGWFQILKNVPKREPTVEELRTSEHKLTKLFCSSGDCAFTDIDVIGDIYIHCPNDCYLAAIHATGVITVRADMSSLIKVHSDEKDGVFIQGKYNIYENVDGQADSK